MNDDILNLLQDLAQYAPTEMGGPTALQGFALRAKAILQTHKMGDSTLTVKLPDDEDDNRIPIQGFVVCPESAQPKPVVSWEDVIDYVDWLEKGIEEWRAVALDPSRVAQKQALYLCRDAFDDLFGQCLSNGMTTAWNTQVDCTKLNLAKYAVDAVFRDNVINRI